MHHKRCPQGLDFQGALATWNSSQEINLPQDVSNIVKKIILIRIQNFENATHRRNADYTCTASFNFWIRSITNIPYQTKPYKTKLYQSILVLKPFLSPLPLKITSLQYFQISMSHVPCPMSEVPCLPEAEDPDNSQSTVTYIKFCDFCRRYE